MSKEIGRLTAKSPSVCSWAQGRVVIFSVPSAGRTDRAKYSASGSVPIYSGRKIGRKNWERSEMRPLSGYGPKGPG